MHLKRNCFSGIEPLLSLIFDNVPTLLSSPGARKRLSHQQQILKWRHADFTKILGKTTSTLCSKSGQHKKSEHVFVNSSTLCSCPSHRDNGTPSQTDRMNRTPSLVSELCLCGSAVHNDTIAIHSIGTPAGHKLWIQCVSFPSHDRPAQSRLS